MVTCVFNPVSNFFKPFAFPSFVIAAPIERATLMPDQRSGQNLFGIPLSISNFPVSVRNENFYGYSSRLKIRKATFFLFKIHGSAATGFICL